MVTTAVVSNETPVALGCVEALKLDDDHVNMPLTVCPYTVSLLVGGRRRQRRFLEFQLVQSRGMGLVHGEVTRGGSDRHVTRRLTKHISSVLLFSLRTVTRLILIGTSTRIFFWFFFCPSHLARCAFTVSWYTSVYTIPITVSAHANVLGVGCCGARGGVRYVQVLVEPNPAMLKMARDAQDPLIDPYGDG